MPRPVRASATARRACLRTPPRSVRKKKTKHVAPPWLQVAKSPFCANMMFEYQVAAAGVVQLGDGQQLPPDQMVSAIEMSMANEWGAQGGSYGEHGRV